VIAAHGQNGGVMIREVTMSATKKAGKLRNDESTATTNGTLKGKDYQRELARLHVELVKPVGHVGRNEIPGDLFPRATACRRHPATIKMAKRELSPYQMFFWPDEAVVHCS
jgi:hypothetical protein